jgi:hypothetical protein
MKYYPFKEGGEYYTIENGEIVKSFWDDESEHLHDLEPNKIYFKTKEDAENASQNTKSIHEKY